VNILIRRVVFTANLVILYSKGINVILGMDWLGKHKGLIDCAKRSVKLMIEDGQEIEHVAESMVAHKGATNHLKLNLLKVDHG
jgi:hypothetical protein